MRTRARHAGEEIRLTTALDKPVRYVAPFPASHVSTTAPTSGRGEFLNPVVHRVTDVEAALAVERESVRKVKLARPGSCAADTAQVYPVIVEQLDAVVGRANPDAVVSVDAD
jgi:hypothetical protein